MLAVNPGGSKEKITEEMKKGMKNFEEPEHEGVTITWNLVQHNLKCCGVTSSTDWTRSKGAPESCYKDATCVPDFSSCTRKPSTDVYEDGCLTKVEEFVKSNTNLVGGIAIGIALFQILGVIIAWKIPKDA